MKPISAILYTLCLLGAAPLLSQQLVHLEAESPFAYFVEDGFPFFTQTLDARAFGDEAESENLTPRGIIFKLGQDHYGCFDPDLLRWSLIWKASEEGEYLTMDGMAPGSYRVPNRKAGAGQGALPKPLGTPLLATPPLPGWGSGQKPSDHDPRERGIADEAEVGLGPIPEEIGRYSGIRLTSAGAELEFEVGGVRVLERVEATDSGVRHWFRVDPREETLWMRSGSAWVSFPPSDTRQDWKLEGGTLNRSENEPAVHFSDTSSSRLWAEEITLSSASRTADESPEASAVFTYDDIPLPLDNPWRRNIRLSGIDFFKDGRAAFCTFDGDVWIVKGLEEASANATWSRFASGLHEPQSLCIVDGKIHVFDRNGIVRLHDTNGNGEADWYENFSHVVAQTAETREFAMDMVATNDGGFYVAKGGQIGSIPGKYNGTIARISPDGRSYDIIATGLRQAYIGYDPETDILTASDQQGNWKPATPIYRIEEGKYYGFPPEKISKDVVHPAPIADPEIWIPHFINPSGAAQVWIKNDAQMGALNGALVHIGYNRPEIFKVYLDESREQGGIVPVLSGFPAGTLKGKVHPLDGRLYLAAFTIWGTSGQRTSGVFRVRPTGAPSWIPAAIEAGERGVLLTFDQEVDESAAVDRGRYAADRWNYEQTHNYGSGNFKLDGEPGQESVPVASVLVSRDRRSLFLGLVGMKPSHTLRVTYRRPREEATEVESAYFTIRSLSKIDLVARGFASDEVDLDPGDLLTLESMEIEPTVELGKEVSLRYGCLACHATDDSPLPVAAAGPGGSELAVGPAWVGLWNSKRTFTDGSFVRNADEAYLRESILDPGRRVPEGYETLKTGVGMPSYLGVLKDHEIDSIILYIQSLGDQ